MTLFLTILHVIVCFLLILVILLQAGKGQGLTGASFGGGNVQSLFGTRGADFLTKATTVAAICFLFTCLGLDVIEARKSRSLLQGAREGAPIDVEAIKKALDKAKATAGEGGESAEKALTELAAEAEGKKVSLEETAEGLVEVVEQDAPFGSSES